MGGGPRTFPGGLNKWQWKRLHEKKARDKEKRLLEHEKQLYQARVRSQIRANIYASENPGSGSAETVYKPMSPQEHIKTLADRFMKEGAEDLWNDDDGPIKIQPPMPKRRTIDEPIDLQQVFISQNSDFSDNDGNSKSNNNFTPGARKFSSVSACLGFHLKGYSGDLVSKNSNNWLIHRRFYSWEGYSMGMVFSLSCGCGNGLSMYANNAAKLRQYSVDTRNNNRSKRFTFTRNLDDQGDSARPKNSGKARFPRSQINRNSMGSSDDSEYSEEEEDDSEMEKRKFNTMASTAALGKYDIKTKKRLPLKFLEDEDDLSHHIEVIRKDVKKRSSEESRSEKYDQETIYSSKRYRIPNYSRGSHCFAF